MKRVWSLLSIADLVAIRAYFAEHSSQAAASAANRILGPVNHLANYPSLGMPTHRMDVRKLMVKNSPYIIPYRIVDGEIEILEVFDSRQYAPRTDLDNGDSD